MRRTLFFILAGLLAATGTAQAADARKPVRHNRPAPVVTVPSQWIAAALTVEETSSGQRWMLDRGLGDYPQERDAIRIRPHGAGVKMKMVM